MSANERKALGRGFSALLQSVESPSPAEEETTDITEIAVDQIGLNPHQPRKEFDQEKLEELAQSIRTRGVIQPILVRNSPDNPTKYELVAGERRLRASKLAGYDKIPVIVKDIKDQELREIALIENIQRHDLNPLEEAQAYRDLLEEHGYTQEDLAKRVGKSRSAISNMIRLLQLPEEIQTDVANNNLSAGHARSLLSISDPEQQSTVHQKIIDEKMSVRDTEQLSRAINKPETDKTEPVSKPAVAADSSLTQQMHMNQERLQELLATKVMIKPNGDSGKIEIEYYSEDDFNRIFAMIARAAEFDHWE